MAKHAPHLHLHYSVYHHLLILPFPPYRSNFFSPSSCFSSSSSSSFNLSPWFIGGGAQFTHIPLTTTPPPPLLPSHWTLISRRGRLSSSSSNRARKRVSERNETIGGVLFLLSGPEHLLCTSVFSSRSQGVVTNMCVSFFFLVYRLFCISILVSKFPGPVSPALKSPWSLRGDLSLAPGSGHTLTRRTNDPCRTHTNWLSHPHTSVRSCRHAASTNPQSTNPHRCTPLLANPN